MYPGDDKNGFEEVFLCIGLAPSFEDGASRPQETRNLSSVLGGVVFVGSGGGGDDGNGDEEAELVGGEKRRRRRTATRTWKQQQQEGRRIQGFCGMKTKWGLQEEEAMSSAMERRSLQKVHVSRCA